MGTQLPIDDLQLIARLLIRCATSRSNVGIHVLFREPQALSKALDKEDFVFGLRGFEIGEVGFEIVPVNAIWAVDEKELRGVSVSDFQQQSSSYLFNLELPPLGPSQSSTNQLTADRLGL